MLEDSEQWRSAWESRRGLSHELRHLLFHAISERFHRGCDGVEVVVG
jgi:hypothetical protein